MSAEPIYEPSLRIIDAHHHLRDRDGEIYLAEQYLADVATGHRIVASVAVETGMRYRASAATAMRPLGETEFLAGVAQACLAPPYVAAAIVGYADLRLGDDVAAVLEGHVSAGRGRFRGVRMATPWHEDARLEYPRATVAPDALRDARFRSGFARLAPLGLTFDAWVYHTQLDDIADLARAFPGTTIVVDHAGGPLGAGPFEGRRREVFTTWRQSVRALAACANVVVKIGGFGMPIMGFGFESMRERPASEVVAEAWRPYIETAVEAFGAARCMFESNFPPDRQAVSYPLLWNAFKRVAAAWSPAERAMLFHDTAARVYGIAA